MKLLTCAIMVKDEVERICRTIDTVKQCIDHLVILDTGSTDGTQDAIRKYAKDNKVPLKLVESEFVDFAVSRNYMLKQCYGLSEFILLLDANDEVKGVPHLMKYLKKMRKKKDIGIMGSRYEWIKMGNKEGNDTTYYRPTVIRNGRPEIYYVYPVHEIITTSDSKRNKTDDKLCKTPFYIFQDRSKDKSSMPRIVKDCDVLKKFLKENGPDTRAYRFLCQSLHSIEDWQGMYDYSEEWLALLNRTNPIWTRFNINYYRALYFNGLARYKIGKEDYYKPLLMGHEHSKLDLIERLDTLYEIATSFWEKRDFPKAYYYMKKVCDIPIPPDNDARYQEFNFTIYKYHRWDFLLKVSYQLQTNSEGTEKEKYSKDVELAAKMLYKYGHKARLTLNNGQNVDIVPKEHLTPEMLEQIKKQEEDKALQNSPDMIGQNGGYADGGYADGRGGEGGTQTIIRPEDMDEDLRNRIKEAYDASGKADGEALTLNELPEDLRNRILGVYKEQINAKKTSMEAGMGVAKTPRDELVRRTEGSRVYLIVSYRDRAEHLSKFIPHMNEYMRELGLDYRIIIAEQTDGGWFNRGILYNVAVKKILELEEKSGGGAKDIYFCFHDVDIIPVKGTNYYRPLDGEVDHLYGNRFSLGGVFLINRDDYLIVNGFSNKYDGWGFEDNDFQRRVLESGCKKNIEYFYERFQGECFKEMDEQENDLMAKMGLPQTKVNRGILEKGIPYYDDGFDQIDGVGEASVEDCEGYQRVLIDTLKIKEINGLGEKEEAREEGKFGWVE